ncbi:MAG: hypothetical protein KC912_10390 [Proteobacteria bacterium]|nr:hypothetical protein [Pseudomonadota bacterium]
MGLRSDWQRVNAHKHAIVLVGVALACAALCSALLRSAPSRIEAAQIVPVLVVWGLVATLPALRRPDVGLLHIAVAAALVRLPLIGAPPLLSDDVYRYLFEGLALRHGHNPFLEAPAALVGLDDALQAQVNHGELTSIYPPIALLWFQLLSLGGTVVWAQALTAAVDVGTAVLIGVALRKRSRAMWPALVYALHPLGAVESAVGAHIDVVAVAFLAAALADPGARGSLWAVLGVGTKLLPGTALVPNLRTGLARHHAAALALGASVLALASVQVLDAGPALFASFNTYAEHWSFNGLAQPLVKPWLEELTRPTLVLVGVAVSVLATIRSRDAAVVALTIGTAFLMLSPTVHPWYALWALVPSLILGRWGWSLASTALMASYAVLWTLDVQTGAWEEGRWVAWISWGPALLVLFAELVIRRRARP